MRYLIIIVFIVLGLSACEKEDLPANPFDQNNEDSTTNTIQLDPRSIEGLHAKIFAPTCANSGCHDGTFEPDFRTVKSTYYTLVYHDIIKQNPSNILTYRVEPGNANQSAIIERLTVDIGGNSGIMPLVVEPGSDWNDSSQIYIQYIKDWINDGAKDIFGIPSTSTNFKPQISGCIIAESGTSNILTRDIKGFAKVPANVNAIDILIAVEDIETALSNFDSVAIQTSLSPVDFSLSNTQAFTMVTPVNLPGYLGQNVDYQFRLTINNLNSLWTTGDVIFMNYLLDDGDNGLVELPGISSMDYLKNYYSFKLMP